ncbi:AraC family transcriptional regulator [Methylorubrum thiocyanatum]|uniref:AraC family transcriptional regulator n=1 Tax=Methylorubrum thiocyanatum TaxID=47958 RepID=UPI00383B8F00
MRKLFSASDYSKRSAFKCWQEAVSERVRSLKMILLDDGPLSLDLEEAILGNVKFIKLNCSPIHFRATHETLRVSDQSGTVLAIMVLSGNIVCDQDGRTSVIERGNFAIIDRSPNNIACRDKSHIVILQIPRKKLEQPLGSVRRFTALNIGNGSPSAHLTSNYFIDLLQLEERLSPDAAKTMSSIGIDLIVATIAERLAQDAPKSLNNAILFQRAKAHICQNFGDVDLDVSSLAASIGVSVRHLQVLFKRHECSVSGCLWDHRLKASARLLSSRGHAHLSIGELAYGCGFENQAHFSRRFKDAYGIAPRLYRQDQLRNLPTRNE